MHIKPTGILTPNEKLLLNAQNSAREGLDDILDRKIYNNNYSDDFYSICYGKKYLDKYETASANNTVWQGFAFLGGLFIDTNNPVGTPTAIANKQARIIVDYTSQVVSGILTKNKDGEPGGRDLLNIIDPFQHEKKENQAKIKSQYVNSTEYKYLIDGKQGNSITKKFINKVEQFKKTVEKDDYKYGNEKQSRIYKKLILEYINTVISENKNHDASVKKLNKEFKKIFK